MFSTWYGLWKSKDLIKRTQSDKAFKIASTPKYNGYQKVCSSYRDNIWGVDLADMQSLNKYNKGMKYLLCTIDINMLGLFL